MLANRVRMSMRREKNELPEGYVMAQDSDFSGTSNGSFRYIGSDLKIIIPNEIKGIAVTRYDNMFNSDTGRLVEGVVSNNPNVTHMISIFQGSSATTLDLSSFDTSNVTNMNSMFYNSSATTLDLSSFDTSNVTDTGNMFRNAQAKTGYARTQEDADRFNASSWKPTGLTFVVK